MSDPRIIILEMHWRCGFWMSIQITSVCSFFEAKFDPPTILKIHTVPKRHGCLKLSWNLSHQQTWIRISRLNLELRLKTAESSQWIDQPVSTIHYSISWTPDSSWYRSYNQKQSARSLPGVISVCLYNYINRSPWARLDQENLWKSVSSSMGWSISPRFESDTRRAPGVNGAGVSLESPWRAVQLQSVHSDTISH